MSTGVSGSDESLSASKLPPLESSIKHNVPHDQSSRGVVGTDRTIDQARLEPTEGNRGQYQHTAPHADEQGVVGRDEVVSGSKIDPLDGQTNEGTRKNPGLGEEEVDTGRIEPLGSVREEMR